jgi:hypothetical protein
MLAALVLACCWIGLRIEKRGAGMLSAIILILLLLASMLTHYYAAHGLLALFIYLMIRLRGAARQRVLLSFCTAAAIFLVLWGPSLWHQRGNFVANLNWSHEGADGSIGRTLLRAAALPVRYLVEPASGDRWIAYGSAVMYVLPALLLRRLPGLLLWWMMLLISVSAVAVADVMRSSWLIELLRYTVVASGAMCALLAIIIGSIGPKLGPIVCALLAAAIGSTLAHTYNFTHEDYGGIGDYLRPRMTRDDALVIIEAPWYPPASNAFYLAATHNVPELPASMIILTKPADDSTLQQLRHHRCLWVIDGTQADLSHYLPGAVARQGDFFPHVATVQPVTIP